MFGKYCTDCFKMILLGVILGAVSRTFFFEVGVGTVLVLGAGYGLASYLSWRDLFCDTVLMPPRDSVFETNLTLWHACSAFFIFPTLITMIVFVALVVLIVWTCAPADRLQ